MTNIKFHVKFFNCGENAKPLVWLQLSHETSDCLEPSESAQYYFLLQMVICDEYTKQSKNLTNNHS